MKPARSRTTVSVFDRAVGSWVGAGSPGPLVGADEMVGERRNRRSQNVGRGVDATLPAAVCQPRVMVPSKRHPSVTRTPRGCGPWRQRNGRAGRPFPAAFGAVGAAVAQETTDPGDQHAGLCAVPFAGELGEADPPLWRIVDSGAQVLGLGDRPSRAARPAAVTQPVALLAAQLAARHARPDAQRWCRPTGARPAPAGRPGCIRAARSESRATWPRRHRPAGGRPGSERCP